MYGHIYKITNTVNNKIYIGKTIHSIDHRFKEHYKTSLRNRSYTSYLYNAMNEHGIENFKIEEIDTAENSEELDDKERFWIKELSSQNPEIGYNIQEGGESGSTRSIEYKPTEAQLNALEAGRHLPSSDLQKQQLALYRTTCVVSEATREKLRIAKLGKRDSKETLEKKRVSHLGKKMPERSETSKENYRNNSSGRIHIHKGTQNKNPKASELDKYLADGWEIGYYYKS